jgi:hypothetical protein
MKTPLKILLPDMAEDWKKFEGLCAIQCTASEIAGIFRISVDTLDRRIKEKFGQTFAEVFEVFSSDGKESLRRALYKSAVTKGNVSAQIFLAKNWLKMRDKSQDEIDAIKTATQTLKEQSAENIIEMVSRVKGLARSGKD